MQAQPQWRSPGDLGDVGRLDDICFVHPDTGWTAGSRGHIFRTCDGGETWEEISTGDFRHHINRFQVFDSTLVYASGATVFKYSE